jgi:hypothetical protein
MSDYDALSSHPNLVCRAIAMHLLREGQFSVASTFLAEAAANPPMPVPTPGTPNPHDAADRPLDIDSLNSESLQQHFTDMYHILHELRNNRNLLPAIAWARAHREALESRGSNLEFDLGRLQFVWLFMGGGGSGSGSGSGDQRQGLARALEYARREFGGFQARYLREIKQLCGALAYQPNLEQSPYRHIFHNAAAWDEVARSFTREFCSLLGLSADSPLYIAATAGAIALPTLLKLASIMKEKRTEWTTQDELPVSFLCARAFCPLLPREAREPSSLYPLIAGRDPSPSLVSVPLHLRLPGVEGAEHRAESADDVTVRPCHRAGISGKD